MKYSKIVMKSILAAAVAVATVACQDEINSGSVMAPEIGGADSYIFVTDAEGNTANISNVELRGSASVSLFANATAPQAVDAEVTFVYDPAVLEQYNRQSGNSFEALPESMISIASAGQTVISAGQVKSAPLQLSLSSDGSLDHSKSYAIPLRVTASAGTVASNSGSRLIFVRDLTGLADCFKTVRDANGREVPAAKIFSTMEINDTNPLNNLCYTLKGSGKYLVDCLVLFSANINYNAETGRVYVFNNPNVQAILDGADKYLRPLQDRGMKVVLSILGNHDRASVANLSPAAAKEFAKELKAICDAYNLDGIFWDDEYSAPMSPAPAGFVNPSIEAWSNLAWEFKQLCPDRWNIAYVYNLTRSAVSINGDQPGAFIDYALHDYRQASDLSAAFPGMPKSNMGMSSQELNLGRWATDADLPNLRNNGYGSHMIFALDPNRSNVERQHQALKSIASILFDDELAIDKNYYKKDW